MGSSPRVRGKRCFCVDENISPGLIPACAGKTRTGMRATIALGAHPRVCGENRRCRACQGRSRGSSPRVRGKRAAPIPPTAAAGLIPACAGKTPGTNFFIASSPAHPRVCGENLTRRAVCRGNMGSSPRVRGKLCGHFLGSFGAGLIPACAGKTRRPRRRQTPPAAHPRVCGENSLACRCDLRLCGSSPRVRGKHYRVRARAARGGLIPACAGKTVYRREWRESWPAHPRVCGENFIVGFSFRIIWGSSPRVRGKPLAPKSRPRGRRLIPACAGKTSLSKPLTPRAPAHPRVCGENYLERRPRARVGGSSPRVRGKQGSDRKGSE